MALLLNANDSVNRSYTITKPSPNHPLDVNGVGVRTENLIDLDDSKTGLVNAVTGEVNTGNTNYLTTNLRVFQAGTYTISLYNPYEQTAHNTSTRVCIYTNGVFDECVLKDDERDADYSASFTLAQDKQVRISVRKTDENVMLNTGSTPLPYEPYGIKIPILSGSVTTNIYLGSTQTVRQVKKLVLDGTENWVHAGVDAGQISNFRIEYFNSAQPSKVVCTHYISPNENISIFNQVEGAKVQTSSQVGMVLIIRPPEYAVWSTDDFKAYLAQQYANGTPVTVWYVLATPETAAVNEPLMKIGNYVDTLSDAAQIPTTEGANSITVGTTVQPSEFTATWTGWHDASVKEWDE